MGSAIDGVPAGRLGVPTLTTAYGVLAAGTTATGPVQNIGAGTAGQAIISGGAGSLPSYTTILATQAQQETGTATDVYVSPGRQQYHQCAAKSWVRWQISSGTPTIDGSGYNVSSLTDTGAGQVTVNFTTSFSGDSYACGALGGEWTSGTVIVNYATSLASALIITSDTGGSLFARDCTTYMSVVFYGLQ